jgi:hypothetical protein
LCTWEEFECPATVFGLACALALTLNSNADRTD